MVSIATEHHLDSTFGRDLPKWNPGIGRTRSYRSGDRQLAEAQAIDLQRNSEPSGGNADIAGTGLGIQRSILDCSCQRDQDGQ